MHVRKLLQLFWTHSAIFSTLRVLLLVLYLTYMQARRDLRMPLLFCDILKDCPWF